jgi:hypothetical protein
VYRYQATLPADPAALRHVTLANNHSDSTAAFRAIMGLLENYPLPPGSEAEPYAVLTGLPGVALCSVRNRLRWAARDRPVPDSAALLEDGDGVHVDLDQLLKMRREHLREGTWTDGERML